MAVSKIGCEVNDTIGVGIPEAHRYGEVDSRLGEMLLHQWLQWDRTLETIPGSHGCPTRIVPDRKCVAVLGLWRGFLGGEFGTVIAPSYPVWSQHW